VIQRIVYFAGRVQGVGFRYRTCEVARRFAVVGTVQNLADGRVKLVAEGESAEVGDFVQAVCETMRANIHAHITEDAAHSGSFQGFRIVP